MDTGSQKTESYFRELRLFLEEICCNLCRFHHHHKDGVLPEQIKISQEVYLGVPGVFADIKVQVPHAPDLGRLNAWKWRCNQYTTGA